MRTKKVFLNAMISFISYFILMFISFANRSIFLEYLSPNLLGLNTLYGDVFQLLSFAEVGLGSVVAFNLYKPLSEHDHDTVSGILNLYRKLLSIIIIGILVMGIFLSPVAISLVNSNLSRSFLFTVYLLQLISLTFSYLWAYKRVYFFVNEQNYLIILIEVVIKFVFLFINFAILHYTSSYILFLIVIIVQTLLTNIIVSMKFDSKFQKINRDIEIKTSIKSGIYHSVRNTFIQKIVVFVFNTSDTFIVNYFLGLASLAALSNYYVIFKSVKSLFGQVLGAANASIGNITNNTDEQNKKIPSFRLFNLISFYIASFVMMNILFLTQRFIFFWIGDDFLLSNTFVLIASIWIYIDLVSGDISSFYSALGLFKLDRNISIIASIINIIVSLVSIRYLGIVGVILGTISGSMLLWISRAYLVYQRSILISFSDFLNRNMLYISILVFQMILVLYLTKSLQNSNFYEFALTAIIVNTVNLSTNLIFFIKTKEQKEIFKKLKLFVKEGMKG